MISPSTLLFLLIAAGSAIVITAKPLDDQEDICPVGFWCRKKRSFENGCPVGFWCKRSPNDATEKRDAGKCVVGMWCKRSDKMIQKGTAEGDCPVGFWCKRDNACPVGFWCRKKREADSGNCPVGFWCKKSSIETEKRSVKLQAYECPVGFWCRRSEYVVDQDTPERDCPANMWCRKRVINSKQVTDRRMPKTGGMLRPRPPKQPLPEVSSDNFGWECPVGFWCKK